MSRNEGKAGETGPHWRPHLKPGFFSSRISAFFSMGKMRYNTHDPTLVRALHYVFPTFPSTHRTIFCSKGTIRTRKIKLSKGVFNRETVGWLQSFALRTLFGHLCLRKG